MKTGTTTRRRIPWHWISGAGLGLLTLVNLGPLLLVLRQAFTPSTVAPAWPLPLLPAEFSVTSFVRLWSTEALPDHLALSAWVASASTILSLAVGCPAGWSAARSAMLTRLGTRFSLLSRVLPPIVLAIPLTAFLIGPGLYNHPLGLGLILAHLTIGVPVALLISYTAFREIPRELEDAAALDGCSVPGVFVRIALPAARGSIASAAVLVFLFSWDEFTYALLIQLTSRTMPPLIYYYTEYGNLAAASTLACVALLPAVVVIAALQRLLVRGVLAGGIQ